MGSVALGWPGYNYIALPRSPAATELGHHIHPWCRQTHHRFSQVRLAGVAVAELDIEPGDAHNKKNSPAGPSYSCQIFSGTRGDAQGSCTPEQSLVVRPALIPPTHAQQPQIPNKQMSSTPTLSPHASILGMALLPLPEAPPAPACAALGLSSMGSSFSTVKAPTSPGTRPAGRRGKAVGRR